MGDLPTSMLRFLCVILFSIPEADGKPECSLVRIAEPRLTHSDSDFLLLLRSLPGWIDLEEKAQDLKGVLS
jgi:hypothetical protein